MRHVITKLIGNTEKSYYRWKKEGRLVIELLEKYFSKEELEEFINTKQITRLELNTSLSLDLAYKFYDIYFYKLLAKENPRTSTLCRNYYLSFLSYLQSYMKSTTIIKNTKELLDVYDMYKNTHDKLAYLDEIEIVGEYNSDNEQNESPYDCHSIIYKILVNFTKSDIEYLVLNLNSDFKYFYEDIKKIINNQEKEFDEFINSNTSPYIQNLQNQYNSIGQIEYKQIGIFDMEIFKAEYSCVKRRANIFKTRFEIDELIKEFNNAKYSLQNEEKVFKKMKKFYI